MISLLLAATSMSDVTAFASPATPFTEIVPLKASMLTKSWQGLLLDVDQKVGIVPDELTGGTGVGVKRFGPELARRTLCKRQFERCYEATFAIATADKTDDATAKRGAIPLLLIDGKARGPGCKTFASISSPATIALVEQGSDDDEWSVLMLIVNPTERNIDAIVAAERTMLQQLCALATSSCVVRVLDKAQETMAGDAEALGLTPMPVDVEHADDSDSTATVWYRCEL